MKRTAVLAYGVVAYLVFFGTFLYLIGFVGNLVVPASLDAGGVAAPLGEALLVDLGLIALFGVQHMVMARPAFKARWTRIVGKAVERSTFVLVTCVILAAMFWQWRAMPAVLWQVDDPMLALALQVVSGAGWAIVLLASFLIDHFDLFGLRQVVLHWLGKPYTQRQFSERLLYRWVRHPLMLGFLVAFWCTPVMTVSHVVFAGAFTTFILIALRVEERDLVAQHGDAYRSYQRRVPMLLPVPRRAEPKPTAVAS